jgi:tetratricopeptide (TPR) repeat protein
VSRRRDRSRSALGRALLGLLLAAPAAAASQASPEADRRAEAQRARELMAAGRYAEAVPVYRTLAAAAPSHAGLQLNLGMALHLSGADREALAPLAAAERLDPASFPAAFFLGVARMQLGQAKAAVAPLSKAVRLRPDDAKARALVAEALVAAGRPADAEPHLERLSRLTPADASVWLALGRAYEAIATGAFEALVGRDPESAQALALVAEARLDGGQPEAALGLYRKAIERAPAMRGLHAALARLYRETGHPDWAALEDERERALAAPDCARTPLECRFAEAKHREVLRAGAGSRMPSASYWVARSANVLAGEAFARLEALPPSAPLHEWRAAQLRDEGRYADSAAQWRQALELAPGDPRRRQELAVTLRLARDLDGAERLLRELLRDFPDSASANYLLGDILLARQQPEPALPLLQKAVRLDPGLAHAHGALGRAYALVGREAEAIPELEKALRVDEDGSLHFQLARAYQAVGRTADAERALGAWKSLREGSAPENAAGAKPALTPP